MKEYKVPYAYLGKTPEAGTSKIHTKSPEQAERILKQIRPNAIVGKAYL